MEAAEPGPALGMPMKYRVLLVESRTATVSPAVVEAAAIAAGVELPRPALSEVAERLARVIAETVLSPEFAM